MIVYGIDDDIGGGVVGPQQPGVLNWLVVGFALEYDQLRRLLAEVDPRHPVRQRRRRLGRGTVQQVGLSRPGEFFSDCVDTSRRFAGPGPVPLQGCRLQPAVVDVQVPGAVAAAAQEQRPGIDNPLEIAVGHGLDHGLPGDGNENGGRIADDDLGWYVAHRHRRALHGARSGQGGLQPVQRDGGDAGGQLLLQGLAVGIAIVCQGGKIAAGEGDIRQGDTAAAAVHLGAGISEEHPENLLVAAIRAGIDSHPEAEQVVLPGLNLWLEYPQGGIAERIAAGPASDTRLGGNCRGGSWRGGTRVGGRGGSDGRRLLREGHVGAVLARTAAHYYTSGAQPRHHQPSKGHALVLSRVMHIGRARRAATNAAELLLLVGVLDMIQLIIAVEDQDLALFLVIPAIVVPGGGLAAFLQYLGLEQGVNLVP